MHRGSRTSRIPGPDSLAQELASVPVLERVWAQESGPGSPVELASPKSARPVAVLLEQAAERQLAVEVRSTEEKRQEWLCLSS
jgi:hypothetical protein